MSNNNISSWRYKIELTYLNVSTNTYNNIKNESVKSLIIDHNFENNCMPTLYIKLSLDRALVDNIINNVNSSLMMLALFKYDSTLNNPIDIECFRKKFTYFLPDDINKNDSIDYSEESIEQNLGDTYRNIQLGLLCLDHMNNNRRSIEVNAKNASMYDVVKYSTSKFDNIVIEPFAYNDTFDQFVVPAQDSVNKALKYMNNQKVFYKTPYRYYQDFDCTYLISSSGNAVPKKDEKISTVIFDAKDITDDAANDDGMITDTAHGSYRIVVSSTDVQVYNNSISNKSKNIIRGTTSTGSTSETLSNNASYSDTKVHNVRINNDNDHMMENIKSGYNSSNVFVNITKNNLDSTVFSINKKYLINHVDNYKEFNGSYILSRKRELYVREDDTFILDMIMNFRKFEE